MKKCSVYLVIAGFFIFIGTAFRAYPQISQTDSLNIEQTQTGTGAAGGVSGELKTSESIPMDLHSVMKNNLKEILNLEMSGGVDEDFAKLMAQHHKGGIKMARVYLQSAQDSRLKKMAEKSIKDQKKEIKKLEAFVARNQVEATNSTASTALIKPIQKMANDQGEMKLNGGIDRQFASSMLEHDKLGVELAEVELNQGTDSGMKEMARKIKEAQKKEIAALENWLTLSGK